MELTNAQSATIRSMRTIGQMNDGNPVIVGEPEMLGTAVVVPVYVAGPPEHRNHKRFLVEPGGCLAEILV